MAKSEIEYYEYKPQDGSKWWVKETPIADPAFQEGLNRIAGFHDRWPVLRLSFAQNLLSDITEKPQLKYKAVRNIITGYNYVKKDGTIGITKSMNLPTDAMIPWQFHPREERIELGRLRWVVEKHVTVQELRQLGRFQNRRAPDGEIVLRELPLEGAYDHYFWIQTAARKYRAPDMEVLTAIEAMWKYEVTTSQAQKLLDEREREANSRLVSEQDVRETWARI